MKGHAVKVELGAVGVYSPVVIVRVGCQGRLSGKTELSGLGGLDLRYWHKKFFIEPWPGPFGPNKARLCFGWRQEGEDFSRSYKGCESARVRAFNH